MLIGTLAALACATLADLGLEMTSQRSSKES